LKSTLYAFDALFGENDIEISNQKYKYSKGLSDFLNCDTGKYKSATAQSCGTGRLYEII